MKLARRYNTLVAATTLLATLSYCVADTGTALLAVGAFIVCAVAWRSSLGDRPLALPRWLVNILMIVAIAHAILKVTSPGTMSGFWTGSANIPIVSTLSQFLIFILLIKLFDRRTPRDEAHVLSLATFVVVGAVLTGNDLLVGVFVLAFAPCVICSAMLLQLVGGARAVQDWAADDAPATAPSLDDPAPAARRRFRRDFAGAASLAILGTLALATVAFIVMPRGLWRDILGGFGKVQTSTQVGFTDQVTLGRSGNLYNSDDQAPVLSIKLSDTSGNKLGELRGTLYLRGAVKSRYDRNNATWNEPDLSSNARDRGGFDDLGEIRNARPNNGGRRIDEAAPDKPLVLADRDRAQILVRQEIRVLREIRSSPYLFTLWRPLDLTPDTHLQLDPPGREVIIRAASGAGSLRAYTITSAFEYSDERDTPRPDVSFNSDVVRSLAQRVLRERSIPEDPAQRDAPANRRAATAISDFLRSNYQYTREMIAPEPREDPIEMFLTRTRRGHCEYFASAMVAMCQSVGLDARLIAGYLATDYNRATGEYTVRQNNAHAWSEVRIGPGRWQTFDPSPPDDIAAIHRPHAGVLARLRQWYEAINITWSTAVVSFDTRSQRNLVGSSERWSSLRESLPRLIGSLREQFSGAVGVLRLASALAILAAIILLARRALRARRARAAAPDDPHADAPPDPALERLLEQAGFYARALQLLAPTDLAKPAHLPPLAHARALSPIDASAAEPLARLGSIYYSLRFGRRPLTDAQRADAEQALHHLDAHLRARAAQRIDAARSAGPHAP